MICVFCDYEIDWKWNQDNVYKALELARCEEVLCLLCGKNIGSIKNQLFLRGICNIIICELNSLDDYRTLSDIVYYVCQRESPELFIFPGSQLGRVVAATVATRSGCGLVADCIDILRVETNKYIFCRTALNSSIIASISGLNSNMMLCTTKQNAFSYDLNNIEKESEVSVIDYIKLSNIIGIKKAAYSIIQEIPKNTEEKFDLLNSRIVFSVGRGVNVKSIKKLKFICDNLGHSLGCTRAVVEAGYLPKAFQIGQSGTIVSPQLGILLGVSGASQHIAGFLKAQVIIAVNKDEKAPIGSFSNYMIIADANEVIDEMFSHV